MLEESIDNIRKLLIAHEHENKLAVDCLAMLSDPDTRVGSSGEVPLGTVRGIYKRRNEINKERGSPIRGFEELINSLNLDTSEKVLTVSIENNIRECFVFTTPDWDRIIGILSFPEKARDV